LSKWTEAALAQISVDIPKYLSMTVLRSWVMAALRCGQDRLMDRPMRKHSGLFLVLCTFALTPACVIESRPAPAQAPPPAPAPQSAAPAPNATGPMPANQQQKSLTNKRGGVQDDSI